MKSDKQHSALEVIEEEQLKRRVFTSEFKAHRRVVNGDVWLSHVVVTHHM